MAEEKIAKAAMDRMRKLLEVYIEVDEKRAAIVHEMLNVMDGKPTVAARLKAFIAAWQRIRAPRYREPYVINAKIDIPQIKRLLTHFTDEQLEIRILNYLRDSDPFYARAKHPISLFSSKINEMGPPPAEDVDFDLESEEPSRPPGCLCTPACRDMASHTHKKVRELREIRE